ncbi:MAG: hypothetical protein IJQ68_10275 [Methanobrevibacter sp.]|uniref:hypothetical protein n=1 Tax=Methanobrevibacter sp. TaxID=66852 RepID=UPI0025D2F612|nr:hypothetical protein [Methanobrevibacter sp.]MBR0272352.1 hypothetical protein [Methanobrevibacter sp.]
MIETLFTVNNQQLKRTDTIVIVQNAKNIIKTFFSFNGEIWENINKFAIFTDSWGNKITTHLGKSCKCSCIVPASCLNGTYFKVTVYGGDLVTTNDVTIPLMKSGYSKHHHQHECHHEHKDIFVDIFDKLDKKIDDILVIDNSIQCYSDGELIDSVSLNGLNSFVDETRFNELIQDYVSKIELKTFLESEGYIKNLDFDFENGELTFEK